jgi:hypothetical protein
MGKPNWVCSECAMWSGRKSSVKRYIAKVHAGKSIMISYIDYLVGRLSGTYPPGMPPQYVSKDKTTPLFSFNDEMNAFKKGYWEERGRKVAQGY